MGQAGGKCDICGGSMMARQQESGPDQNECLACGHSDYKIPDDIQREFVSQLGKRGPPRQTAGWHMQARECPDSFRERYQASVKRLNLS